MLYRSILWALLKSLMWDPCPFGLPILTVAYMGCSLLLAPRSEALTPCFVFMVLWLGLQGSLKSKPMDRDLGIRS